MKLAAYMLIASLAIAGAGCAGQSKKGTGVTREPAGTSVRDDESRDACLKAIKRARTDARNGTYRMYVFGSERYDARFAGYLSEYLKTGTT